MRACNDTADPLMVGRAARARRRVAQWRLAAIVALGLASFVLSVTLIWPGIAFDTGIRETSPALAALQERRLELGRALGMLEAGDGHDTSRREQVRDAIAHLESALRRMPEFPTALSAVPDDVALPAASALAERARGADVIAARFVATARLARDRRIEGAFERARIVFIGSLFLFGAMMAVLFGLEAAERRATRQLADNEAALRVLFEQANFGIAQYDFAAARFVRTNPLFAAQTASNDQAVDERFLDHLLDLERPSADSFASKAQAVNGRDELTRELQWRNDAGEARWFLASTTRLRNSEGATTGLIVMTRDIHDRKLAEQGHREALARYAALVESSPDAILVCDGIRVAFANTMAVALFGAASADDMCGRQVFEFVPAAALPRLRRLAVRLRRGESLSGHAFVALRLDQDTVEVEFSARTTREGDAWRTQLVVRDLTARNRARADLEASKQRLDLALRAAGFGAWEWDADTRRFAWGPGAAEVFGRTALGTAVADIEPLVLPDDRALVHRTFASAVKDDEPFDCPMRILLPDGSVRPTHVYGRRLDVRFGGPHRVIGLVQDLTVMRAQEQALRESRALLQLLYDATPYYMGMVEILGDDDFRYLSLNAQAAAGIYQLSPSACIGQRVSDLGMAVETRRGLVEHYHAAMASGQPRHFEYERITDEGLRVFESIVTGFGNEPDALPRGAFISIDVTERRRLEAEQRQMHKMEAVGRLAAGVAHDFNNILAIILGYVELLRFHLEAEHAALRYVHDIEAASRRAADVARQLLVFSRRQVLKPRVEELGTIVIDTERMLRRLLGDHITIETRLSPDALALEIDRGQLEQVIINLAVNARDAMPGGGRMLIETRAQRVDGRLAGLHGETQSSEYVVLGISDSGHGVSDANIKHIFEPFFTTKAEGFGTGLGLAAVFGIVKQSGGFIDVRSTPGVGTCIEIYLPRCDRDILPSAVAASVSKPESAPGSRTEGARPRATILLVEDEDQLRGVLRQMLESAGYSVFEAASAGVALEQVASSRGGFDLLVTDLVLPDTSGQELAAELRRVRPELSTLVMSGYTDVAPHGHDAERVAFIRKPFAANELVMKVEQTLGARSEAKLRL